MTAVRQSNGAFITVSDDEIMAAIPKLARGCAVFSEPAGAAAYAGLEKAVAQKLVKSSDRIVVINTGNGLKDIQSAMKAVELAGTRPTYIKPRLEEVKAVIKND